MQTRIRKLAGVTVEHVQGADYGTLDAMAAKHPKGVQHTTEGGFEGSLEKLRHVDSPHFLLGRDNTGRIRVVQLVDIGKVAGAVEHPKDTPPTNGLATVQIELVGFSRKTLYLPDPGVTEALAALYAVCFSEYEIALKHTPNPKRNRLIYSDGTGWFGHCDVPDQPSGHWDPGMLDYTKLFVRARKMLDTPDWYLAACAQSPLWAWMTWRDNGQPADLRPPQIPVKVPRSWHLRYLTHIGRAA